MTKFNLRELANFKNLRLPQLFEGLALVWCILLALISLGIFVHLAWIGYISDSEIWSVTLAKHLREEWMHPWVFTRPEFYGVLGFFELFASSAIAIFMAAKIAALLNGLLILFFAFRLAKILATPQFPSVKWIPWAALALLLANSGFFKQGYRIRSDLFGCSFTLFALGLTLRQHREVKASAMLSWFTPLLATPKAILQIIPFAVFPIPRKARGLALGLLILACGGLLVFYPGGVLYFAVTMFGPGSTLGSFQYVSRLLASNHIFFSLLFLRFITLSLRLADGNFYRSPEGRQHLLFAGFVLLQAVVLVFSPEKVPFFIAIYLPVASVFSALIFDDSWALIVKLAAAPRRPYYQAALVSGLCLVLSFSFLGGLKEAANYAKIDSAKLEFSSIQILENYLNSFPQATYFDVVGLVPERASIRRFAGPNDPRSSEATVRWIASNPPNLIFYVEKCAFLEPGLTAILTKRYFPLRSDIFARWEYISSPITLTNLSKAELHLRIQGLAHELGKDSVENVSMLLSSPQKRPWRVEFKESDWDRVKKFYKGEKILAFSAFTNFDPKPAPLRGLIRFDGFY